MTPSARHCLELVRAGDKDRFLASLFAPEDKRARLLALYAFNIEITRIPALVSEPRIGEIRQQWWLDTLAAIYRGETVAHPVAQELALAIGDARLPLHGLRGLVEARQFDLYSDPMSSLESLEAYLGETSSAIIQLSAIVLAGSAAQSTANAAGLAGVAYGLARLLCSGRAKSYLPRDLVQAKGEAETLAVLAQHARRRIEQARTQIVPSAARPAFLTASLTDLYLDKLDRMGRDALKPIEVPQLRRQWRLWWMARAERF